MKVLVVDDEPIARRRMTRMLRAIPLIEVVGEARDGLEAVSKANELAPDLLVLDIEMPALDGVTLAQRVKPLPLVLFVTAHAEHAVEAFDVNAVDYLLKPVQQERLALAIDRARERLARKADGPLAATEGAGAQSAASEGAPRVVSRSNGVTRFFDAQQITRFWAKDKCTLFVVSGEEHFCDESLDTLEERLARVGFVRVHRAELVNAKRVRALHQRSGTTHIELDDGTQVPVARRALSAVKTALGL
ncbi:MAG: response regulator transcription factor [Myxococcales bacterium]|nr:response regulator transcription factor [Myxococcales bacterium]